MGFWKSLKFWVKDSFKSRGTSVTQSDGLWRTVRDASHVRGGGAGGGGGLARSPSEEVLRQVAEGHEDYQKSFKKDRES